MFKQFNDLIKMIETLREVWEETNEKWIKTNDVNVHNQLGVHSFGVLSSFYKLVDTKLIHQLKVANGFNKSMKEDLESNIRKLKEKQSTEEGLIDIIINYVQHSLQLSLEPLNQEELKNHIKNNLEHIQDIIVEQINGLGEKDDQRR